jgi:hypothetical protein
MKFLSGGMNMWRNGRRLPMSSLLSGRALLRGHAVLGPSRGSPTLGGTQTVGLHRRMPLRKIRAARDQRRENGWPVWLSGGVPARGLVVVDTPARGLVVVDTPARGLVVVDTAQPRGSGTTARRCSLREAQRLAKRAALIVREHATPGGVRAVDCMGTSSVPSKCEKIEAQGGR